MESRAKDVISEFEYGQMLYNNPRGVSCVPCHGLKGEGRDIVEYKEKTQTVVLKAPDIRDKSFEQFKKATSKGPGIMPRYFLTQKELRTIFQYIKSVYQKEQMIKDKNGSGEVEDADEDEELMVGDEVEEDLESSDIGDDNITYGYLGESENSQSNKNR